MTSGAKERYERVMESAAELADLESAASLLGWDQETTMPPKGVDGRSHVAATMAGIIHQRLTDPELAENLDALSSNGNTLGEVETAQVKELARLQRRAAKVPRKLVQAMAEHESRSTAVWAECKKNKDFASFVPSLSETYSLKREMAEAIGYKDNIYDALLDDYEPGAKTKDLMNVLNDVKDFLIPVVQKIVDSGVQGDPGIVSGPFDTKLQDQFGREMIAAMGFDMEAGRLDISNHPFTSGIHAGDIRLTTKYQDELTVGLFGTLHETGHGLYEQNLPSGYRRTPLGPSTSLGIHESQSRLWENNVGRSLCLWKHFFPRLQKLFPGQLGSVSLDDYYRAINIVEPSLVRIESDEVTYNLHIVLRVELEQELLGGTVAIKDLSDVWNERFKQYLGIEPPSVDKGVLQDIHWAVGLIGYFATYTLGNLYAAMFYDAAKSAIPDLEGKIAQGNLIPLRDWLIENVHKHGRRYSAEDLAKKACGKPFSADPFKSYVREKFGAIYGVTL